MLITTINAIRIARFLALMTRCRHPLASVLVLRMDLEAVIQISRRYRCSSHSSSRGIPRSMMPRESSDLTRQLAMMVSPLSRSKTHWLS